MKTLEELGYEKVKENEDEIVYEDKDVRRIRILINKKTKKACRDWKVNGYCLRAWLSIDEMKAVLAILEEKE